MRPPLIGVPDRLYMEAPGLTVYQAHQLAIAAVESARHFAPKLSGASSRRFVPLYGPGFFGIRWLDSYIWFQEIGINPFTMRSLAGKTIPMWINDADGSLHRKNPKAETRVTIDGRQQVLIFRRAAKQGQRKISERNGLRVSVPASYPGAPGRIASRNANGQIARGNVGVRWRHPGLGPKSFLHRGMVTAALDHDIPVTPVVAANQGWR